MPLLVLICLFTDKSAGGRVSQQFEEASQRLQDYCECLGIEVNERINILDMLKECTIFTAYRLAELQRTSTVSDSPTHPLKVAFYIIVLIVLQDYKNLNVSVNDVKKKIDQRLKDLERAHSTATSDPSAKEDITDIGDMEIESDGESQDSQDGAAKPQPTAPRSLMSAAPGMLMAPPMTTYPGQQQQQLPDRASKRGGFVRPPPLPINNYQIQQAIPPPPPPQQQQKQKQLQHTFNRPRFQAPQTRLGRPPPRTDTGGMMRQLPPRQRPPPPQRLQGPNPQMNSFHHVPSPRVGAMHLFRGPVPRPRVPGPPKPSAPNQHKNEPFTIASSPVLYVKPNEEHPPTGTGRESKNVNNEGPPTGNLADSKKSLDDRLKDMMLLNKKFGNAILNEQEVDSTPDRPYSPSAEDAVMDSSVGIVEGPDLEDDRQSIPTPSSDSPSEEVSPGPNMDNPILKALYTSQTSPDHKPASLVPDYDQEDDELSSSDLKNILHQVISSEPTETKIGNPPLGEGRVHPPPVSVVVGDGDQSRKSSKPSEIKITPTLTSLLDEIFPKISKSLMDRKRKQDEGSNDAATKMLRLADTPPKTHLPRPQQVPQFHPRPPFEGVRYPSPFPAGQPVAKPTENFPRPFISYEATRPISNHMMGNRFGRPMGPSFLGVGMQPRVRPYGVYRAPRYRPQHPRYA